MVSNTKKLFNIQLVEGWNLWYKQFSTWMVVFGSVIVNFTPELVNILSSLPYEILIALPDSWIRSVGLILILLSIAAKLVRQQKLYEQVQAQRNIE